MGRCLTEVTQDPTLQCSVTCPGWGPPTHNPSLLREHWTYLNEQENTIIPILEMGRLRLGEVI